MGSWSGARASLALAFGLSILSTAAPAAVTFTKIAESSNFYGLPAINNSGTVAFGVTNASTFSAIQSGNGGPLATIATNSLSVGSLGVIAPQNTPVSINDSGVVAFLANFNSGNGVGVFTGSGGALTVIDSVGTTSSYIARPSINPSGTTAYFKEGPSLSGIYAGNGGAPVPLVTSASPTFSAFINLQQNDSGAVAFAGQLDAGGVGIFSTANLASPIAQYPFPGSSVTSDAIVSFNNSGTALFLVNSPPSLALMTSSAGGTPALFLDDSSPYADFVSGSINNLGQIAFLALSDDNIVGIYTGPDPVANKIVEQGDEIFGDGRLVLNVGMWSEAINDSGQVAFSYFLDDFSFGVAVATVPEPSMSIILALALLHLRRKR